MNKQKLKEYDLIVDNLVKEFVEKYFDKDYIFDKDYYWVGQDEDREVLAVSDYFFNIEDIISFIRYEYTEKEIFDYYEYRLDEKKSPINIKNWKRLKN